MGFGDAGCYIICYNANEHYEKGSSFHEHHKPELVTGGSHSHSEDSAIAPQLSSPMRMEQIPSPDFCSPTMGGPFLFNKSTPAIYAEKVIDQDKSFSLANHTNTSHFFLKSASQGSLSYIEPSVHSPPDLLSSVVLLI